MAVAAPKRRSQSQTAPAPARTAPPEPKKRPRDRPRPGGPGRSAAAAAAPATAPATAPKRKPAVPKRKSTAPKRKAQTAAPARKTAPKRRAPGRVIPIAAGTVGRTAVAVTQLPESGLIHRLTRGRAWIGVLGVLLIGIVALNVVTLSFAASAGKVYQRNQELSRENSVLQSLQARKYGQARIDGEAKKLGLSASTAAVPTIVTAGKGNVATAAARLAAAGAGASASVAGGQAGAGKASTSGEEAASGEAGMSAEEAATINLEGLSQEEKNAIYEETLAREAGETESAAGGEAVGYEESATEVPAG